MGRWRSRCNILHFVSIALVWPRFERHSPTVRDPDARLYNTAVRAALVVDAAQAEPILKAMAKAKVQRDIFTYNILAAAAAK